MYGRDARSRRIKPHTTLPYHPVSNGVAERAIGVLTGVRAMLRDSDLPGSLWAEAFNTASYVYNRTPTEVLKGLIPFEARYGAEPDLAHLRAFGAPCSIVEPLEKLRKLDDQASICYFVGYQYGGGGYRVWDPKVVVESMDGVFFEDGLPPPTLADVKTMDPEPTTRDDEPLASPLTTSVPTQNALPLLAPPVVQGSPHDAAQTPIMVCLPGRHMPRLVTRTSRSSQTTPKGRHHPASRDGVEIPF